MIYIENRDTRSDYNLALEQYVFDQMPKSESYFILWRNCPSIIIGKYQNTIEEVNAAYVKENGIPVVRRLSGGGAVYHDLGNINYTYITDGNLDGNMNLGEFCNPLIAALESVGINAELSGRNDILVDGKKVSGNAQYCRNGRIMHHGTILYNSDLSVLEKALKVTAEKIQSKGIKSVRSRVANIIDYMKEPLPVEDFQEIIRIRLCSGEDVKKYELQKEDMEAIEKIRLDRYGTWEWNWGNSPAYTVCKERKIEGCGNFRIYLQVEEGRVKECQFCGDFFGDGPSEELLQALKGCLLRTDSLQEALKEVDISQCFFGMSKEQLIDLLVQ